MKHWLPLSHLHLFICPTPRGADSPSLLPTPPPLGGFGALTLTPGSLCSPSCSLGRSGWVAPARGCPTHPTPAFTHKEALFIPPAFWLPLPGRPHQCPVSLLELCQPPTWVPPFCDPLITPGLGTRIFREGREAAGRRSAVFLCVCVFVFLCGCVF